MYISYAMVKVGIIFSSGDGKFYTEISRYIDDPDTHFLFSDEHPILARYLHQLQYRKCTVYHIGGTPKHKIGKYVTKGGFTSYVEIEATIRELADVVIEEEKPFVQFKAPDGTAFSAEEVESFPDNYF